MKTLEIIFGNSCNSAMQKSKLNKNSILLINALFNVGDLSTISDYIIGVPKDLCQEEKNYFIKNEVDIIINNIKLGNKIRVWTSNNDTYSYLVLLYVSSIVEKYNYDLYVTYSDDYNKEYVSPRVMNGFELEKLSTLEHKLRKDEILNYSKLWDKLVTENADLRIIENGTIKSVSIDYYDKVILNMLNTLGKVKITQFVGLLMREIHLQDKLVMYLIKRLIKQNKIKIELSDNIEYVKNTRTSF